MLSLNIEYHINQFTLQYELSLNAGQTHAIVGSSGSGKTTLLRLLSGLLRPHKGWISYDKTVFFDHQKKIFVAPQKRNIGLIFQDYALFDHMTIYQNIAYGVAEKNPRYIVNNWLARIGLEAKAKDYPVNLSGGEKQRVAIARAMAASPRVLLMDEPFAALNSQMKIDLRRELKKMISDSGVPVIIATHDLEDTRLLADEVSVLSQGKLLQQGKMNEVFNAPNSIDSARALGWNNILKIQDLNDQTKKIQTKSFLTNAAQSLGRQYIAIPSEAISLEIESPDFTGRLVDLVQLNTNSYCDIEIEKNNHLQMMLVRTDIPMQIGGTYGFKIDLSRVVFLP